MSGPRIPVGLVTGFLGSGKTTLIKRLLERPQLAATLVIVNEFGEVGIDHDLLEASSDDTILLANGCLCCTIRGNLVDTLLDVLAQRQAGRLRDFDRVIVETSGVADPAPILGFVFEEPRVAARFRPGAVITTCDAVAGLAVLERHAEAVAQVVLADKLLVTKADLAPPGAVEALTARLRALNAAASIRISRHGDGLDGDEPWALSPRGAATPSSAGHHAHDGHDDHGHHDLPHIDGRHALRFRAVVLEARRILAVHELDALADAIRRCAGPGLLRLKGLLAVGDGSRCGVLQAAPGTVHPPALLDAPAPQPGRLVLIAEGAPSPALLDALAAFDIAPVARSGP
ncbi:MAG: GTP-binding protein [Alphaproteobacteria bacterium]|nr:GTP-binding protein [Alphaproteobacteria bacterium]